MASPRSIGAVCKEIQLVDGQLLRPWGKADAAVLVDAWNDPEIQRWNPVPDNPTLDLARTWIAGTDAQTEQSNGIDVVLVDEAGQIAGEIGLQVDRERRLGEVGFWLTSNHRGSGYGRSLLAAANALRVELGLIGLVAMVDAKNGPALGLLASCDWTELETISDRRAFAVR